MRHPVLDMADSNACDSAYDRNELQTLFAMLAVVHPISKQKAGPSYSTSQLALWWQRRKHGLTRAGREFGQRMGIRGNTLAKNETDKNPQRAASPLMSHRPAGRRAPEVQPQQALFAVLDQMGARHAAARRTNPFSGGENDSHLS